MNTATINDDSSSLLLLLNKIKEYITYRTDQLRKDGYHKMLSFRGILLQRHQRSSLAKTTIGVSPEPYLDLISNPFDRRQWNNILNGK